MNNKSPAVEIKNLSVRFGSFTAVDDISFSVQKGEIFGFLGANGAGKTTTIRVICGLLLPTSGEVTVAGEVSNSGENRLKEKVGYMSQKFTLYDDLTVGENLYFKAALRKIDNEAASKKIPELFKFIGFSHSPSTLVRELPTGAKQQISLAATLLHDPEIIFLDEPTAGVSPGVRDMFWKLIEKLAKEGKTVIVTTHYMDEAEQCRRIALMRSGRLIALDSPQGLKKSAYPEPLLRLSGLGRSDSELLAKISADPAVEKIWPFGMRYHASLKSEEQLESFKKRLPERVSVERISPSLDDVFLKLVEGAER
ncbi:MAG TPA: ABC transporter ATP-binding protein [Elusimicrobia bacterium]|nr:MAG: hypothetical protein A2278_05245 [Elusimicrobia bacterium RIFOXYA12_FULL_49_49]OGS15236.1 MAG: hypothetical protein A2251_06975 [Elusimicrobia bacterium RIFOXYA2_FULL_47_53]OGS25909.1 MAG: hypothetical protein A2339_00830 [Elusimicrobia bacterium RIFOXYB12_FULL_50_12]OGS30287.1 MAG: hypothetical protein A2323_05550 [Elusimicrobia bacterium RIFOXYB2_FULL_46_23]HBU70432.1 ABC transporter ATP-binding protein [Elusimicrobiota bacterium]